jgi:hypothetical protein
MTTDREYLELAAKAADVRIDDWDYVVSAYETRNGYWNPLTDDGDEARLEAALELHVEWHPMQQTVSVVKAPDVRCTEPYGKDRQAARRRAGVRAAAEIGKEMK